MKGIDVPVFTSTQVNLFAPQTSNVAFGVVRALITDSSDTSGSLSFIDSDGQVNHC